MQRATWTDERLDDLAHRVDMGFERVDRRFEMVDRRFEHVDRRFDKVEEAIRQLHTTVVRGAAGLIVALAVIVIAGA